MNGTHRAQGSPARFEASAAHGAVTLVSARGELDLSTSEAFRELLARTVAAGSPDIVIDVSELTFCDSQGLGALLAAEDRAAAAGGAVRLTGVRPPLARLLRITGFDQRLRAVAEERSAPAVLAD